MEFKHVSVLLRESIDGLAVRENGVYVDGTLGGGGHAEALLSAVKNCRLIGIDQDIEAIAAAKKRLSPFSDRVTYVNDNFKNVKTILNGLGITGIDGAMLDLGVSSYQLDNAERGFSYMHDAPLDMRMNRNAKKSAYDVVNGYSEQELTRIFYEYGEEKWSKRIAEFIVSARDNKTVNTTLELSDIIKAAIPKKARLEGGHPAKRVFQAIRIEVNGEIELLDKAVRDFAEILLPNGRMSVITFHSLEDRIVKRVFAELSKGCVCPPDFPVCVCGRKPQIRLVTRKPIIAGKEETENNQRSKSAKLRIIEKI